MDECFHNHTLPEVLAALPVRREMMVAPLGPMMAHKRPGLKEPFTFFMIVLPLGRVKVMSAVSYTGTSNTFI